MWLLTRVPVWLEIFAMGAKYALADGVIGLLTVALLARRKPIGAPPPLLSLVLADAVLRCTAGIATLAFPGIPYFPITLVLFYGALGVWAASAGVIAMVAWFVAHEHEKDGRHRSPSRTHALFDPLAAAGLIAFLLAGYAFIVGPPASAEALRLAAGSASGALALVLLVAASGAAGRRLRRDTTPRRVCDRGDVVA
ncbi:MAG: hypothetical protein WD801_00935 [Gemmatimonadaceae bacterium]